MCKIIQLLPNVILPYDMFETACFNNWHGYGIVLKENNRLQVIKDCPEKGNDPEKIYKILEENKDIERFIHLRYKTEGDVDLHNTQPFPAYISNKREVFFMHNGTLYEYKNKTPSQHELAHHYQGWMQDLEDDNFVAPNIVESDSKRFCDQRIVPFLAKIQGENGKGDIHDPLFVELISKYWSTGNKGLLISSDQDPLFINKSAWETIKFEGGECLASNNDYFKELKRGPVYEQRKAQREALAEKNRRVEAAKRQSEMPWKDVVDELKSNTFSSQYELSEKIVDLLEDFDLYTPAGWVALSNLTYKEIEKIYEALDKENLCLLFLYLTSAVKEFNDELELAEKAVEDTKSKLERATKRIATLVEAKKKEEEKEKEVA